MKCLLLFYFLTLFLCYILAQDDPGEIVYPVYINVRNDDYDPYLLLFALPLIGPILLSLLDGLTDGVNLILGQVSKGLGGGGEYEMRVAVIIVLLFLWNVVLVISQLDLRATDSQQEIVHPVYINVRNDDYDPYLIIFALPLLGPFVLKFCEAVVQVINGMMSMNGNGNGDEPVPT